MIIAKIFLIFYQRITLCDGGVDATGFEPVTPAVSRQCSTAELRTQKK